MQHKSKTTLADEIKLFNSHLDFYRSLIRENNKLLANPPKSMTQADIEKRLAQLKVMLDKEKAKIKSEELQMEKKYVDKGYHAIPEESPSFLNPRDIP